LAAPEETETEMPIYEYACAKCEREFEVEQRITEDPLKACPECGSRRVKRLISRTSFVLKGGGWYADAYSSSGKAEAKSDSGGESGGGDDSGGGGAGESDAPKKPSDTKTKSGAKPGKSGKKSAKAAA
jgi:putative FmdB family regulatory protein